MRSKLHPYVDFTSGESSFLVIMQKTHLHTHDSQFEQTVAVDPDSASAGGVHLRGEHVVSVT